MRAFTDKETVEQVGKLHMTAMLAAPGIVIVESQGARTWRATQLGNKPGYIEITAIEGDRSARVYGSFWTSGALRTSGRWRWRTRVVMAARSR